MLSIPSVVQRIYHGYLAFVYAFTYRTTRRSFLGFSLSGLIKAATLILLLVTWLRGWEPVMTAIVGPLVVWVQLAYWRSRRAGYVRFIPDKTAAVPDKVMRSLPPNQRVDLWVTGVFAVQDWEEYLLLRRAQYWQVPLGDHIVMAQAGNEEYLYQFFNANTLQEVELGSLLFGTRLHETISITFLETQHLVQPSQFNFARPEDIEQPVQERTILFTFVARETKEAVWHNILSNFQRRDT